MEAPKKKKKTVTNDERFVRESSARLMEISIEIILFTIIGIRFLQTMKEVAAIVFGSNKLS